MKVGNIFKYKNGWAIHTDVDGCVGIVLSKPNHFGQYKVMIKHKVLHIRKSNMEKVCYEKNTM